MRYLLATLFLVAFTSINATHNRAGEIVYKRIAPFVSGSGSNTITVYTYSITVIKYTDNGPTIADRCIDTVYFGDGTKGIAPRINTGLTCSCGTFSGSAIGCGSLIVNNPTYKVRYSVYSIIHTYNGAGTYIISSSDPNRNAGVVNIPNSSNYPFCIESMIIIGPNLGANSSPDLTLHPIDQASVGVCFYHNTGAVDADGDSLSFSIVPCQSGPSQTVPGYSYPTTGASGSFSIHPSSGLLTWCVPQLIGEYNMAIKITEWRKNSGGIYQVIGYVIRDMQVLVKPGIVGLSQDYSDKNIKIYPNPFKNQVELDLEAITGNRIECTLFANDGRLIYTHELLKSDGKLILSPGELESGLYLLRIQTEEQILYKKVVHE